MRALGLFSVIALFLGGARAEEAPEELTLKEAVTFPAVWNGKVIGKIGAAAGSRVKVVAVEGGEVTVEYQGTRQRVAVTITDFEERMAARKAAGIGTAPTTAGSLPASGNPQAGPSVSPGQSVLAQSVEKNGEVDVKASSSGLAGGTPALRAALERAGENRGELEKALAAARDTSVKEMELLISRASQYDLVNLTTELLLDNVSYYQKAKKEMPWAGAVPEAMWLEYVLPYRVADEDLDDWRPEFYGELSGLVNGCRDTKTAARAIHEWLYKGGEGGRGRIEFKVTESRDQTPRQFLNGTKIGRCFEMNLLLVALLRSAGIPSRMAGVPWWTTMDYYHYWVEYWDTESRQWLPLEPGTNPDALMAKSNCFAAVYAFPGFCVERDPVGKERWDLLLNVTASYAKVGTLNLSCAAPPGASVTFAVYVWNLSAWRVAATAQGNGKASFELAANEKQYPYLVSAGVNGRLGWRLVRVTAGKTELVTLMPGVQPEMVMEYKQ